MAYSRMFTQGDAERGSAEGKLKISIEVRLCTGMMHIFADVLAGPVLPSAEIEIALCRKTSRWCERWSRGIGCAGLGEI
jgi:hypothetical protein